jgi:tetratricopeptide (TPR) repeat protein
MKKLTRKERKEKVNRLMDRMEKSTKVCIEVLLNMADLVKSVDFFTHALGKAGIKLCNEVLEIDPDNVDALLTKAELWMWLGRMDCQRQCYDRVLELDPENVEALAHRGLLAARIDRDPDNARHLVSLAVDLDPENLDALHCKGLTLMELGETEEAIECYEKMLAIDPGNEVARNLIRECKNG